MSLFFARFCYLCIFVASFGLKRVRLLVCFSKSHPKSRLNRCKCSYIVLITSTIGTFICIINDFLIQHIFLEFCLRKSNSFCIFALLKIKNCIYETFLFL